MKRKPSVITIGILVLGLVLAGSVLAQRGAGGWGASGRYARMYDPNTVETVTGTVASVDEFTPMRGMSKGIHLTLATGKERLPVHLGPAWYIDRQALKIAANDKVEVTGSRITFDGKPTLLAAQVKKGDQVLKLRNANGTPVWSGWRRRGR